MIFVASCIAGTTDAAEVADTWELSCLLIDYQSIKDLVATGTEDALAECALFCKFSDFFSMVTFNNSKSFRCRCSVLGSLPIGKLVPLDSTPATCAKIMYSELEYEDKVANTKRTWC